MMRNSRKKKVMVCYEIIFIMLCYTVYICKVWVESQYPVLAEVFKTTQTADSFHLAEENKEEFPHDDVR